MGRLNHLNGLLIGIFIGIVLGNILLGAMSQMQSGLLVDSSENSLNVRGSTDPLNPQTLSSDVYDYEYYSSSYYYYKTASASSSYYHVVWVLPTSSEDDFDMYLYSDSSYSIQKASSTHGSGYLDWVVFRPSSSQYYYPKVRRYSGSGYAYIEWEQASSASLGNSYSYYLATSEAIEIYRVYLSISDTYDITLKVPSGANYDLYLFYLTSGAATNYNGYIQSSMRTAEGRDELIANYRPSYSDYYGVVVVRRSGSGSFTLKIDYHRGIGVIGIMLIIFGLLGVIIASVVVYNKYVRLPERQEPAQQRPRRTNVTIGQNRSRTYIAPTQVSSVRPVPSAVSPQSPRPLQAFSPPPTLLFCPYCGFKNEPNALFCLECGSEL